MSVTARTSPNVRWSDAIARAGTQTFREQTMSAPGASRVLTVIAIGASDLIEKPASAADLLARADGHAQGGTGAVREAANLRSG